MGQLIIRAHIPHTQTPTLIAGIAQAIEHRFQAMIRNKISVFAINATHLCR